MSSRRRTFAPSPSAIARFGAGQITILAPAGERASERRDRRRHPPNPGLDGIARLCRRRRLSGRRRDARLAGAADLPRLEGERADAVRPVAERPRFGRLDRGLEERPTTPNFGCATQSVLAAQVDDPRDLAQTRAQSTPRTSTCGCGRSATCARARIPEPTGRSRLRRSVRSGSGES